MKRYEVSYMENGSWTVYCTRRTWESAQMNLEEVAEDYGHAVITSMETGAILAEITNGKFVAY